MKKKTICCIFILLIVFLIITPEYVCAVEDLKFCNQKGVLQALRIVGTIKNVAKILIPVLLIIMASIDLAKVVFTGDEKDFKEAGKKILQRVIAGIIVFFIPTIVDMALMTIKDYENNNHNFAKCGRCFATPTKANCDDRATE